jgi:HSP20 family molecular chaperone IbpA
VEADLPGVKRENLGVKVGDRGRSLLIEGKVMNKLREKAQQGMYSTYFGSEIRS